MKNFEGEYYFDGDTFRKINGTEVKNPLLQLERNLSLLRQFFNYFGFNTSIEPYLVFVNPDFTLYNAPLNKRIILPTNLNRFIHQLNNNKSTLNDQHSRLSEKLLSSHLTKSPFTKIPKYEYSQLRKGVFCHSCGKAMEEYSGRVFMCNNCSVKENTKSALIRSVKEFNLLNPLEKMSTNIVYEWCGGVFPKKTIRQVIKENFITSGYGQWSYYE
ncbi:nuclease-related domain-containing protein [Mesobacillus jeotgali]|uniref:nuclease-related domain-containing protein n=1 Tax=Mesobacillus jeotgali TaxID=129985 RepID=UPI001CFEE0F9